MSTCSTLLIRISVRTLSPQTMTIRTALKLENFLLDEETALDGLSQIDPDAQGSAWPVGQEGGTKNGHVLIDCHSKHTHHFTKVGSKPVNYSVLSSLFSSVLSEPAPKEPEKKLTGFWDAFATKWNQTSEANKVSDGAGEGEAEAAAIPAHDEDGGTENTASPGAYTNLEATSDPGFKWNFVTS
eukprot:g27194.t1